MNHFNVIIKFKMSVIKASVNQNLNLTLFILNTTTKKILNKTVLTFIFVKIYFLN